MQKIKENARAIFSRFSRCRDGLAATEFALILPIITVLFFGMLETSDALSVNRRMTIASSSLVDLVGQATEVSQSELQDIITGVERMISLDGSSTMNIKISSIIADPDDSTKAIVHWSRDKAMAEPYTAGAQYSKLNDSAVLKSNLSLLVVELDVDFTSGLSQHILGANLALSKQVVRLPRRSNRVQFCTDDAKTNCTS